MNTSSESVDGDRIGEDFDTFMNRYFISEGNDFDFGLLGDLHMDHRDNLTTPDWNTFLMDKTQQHDTMDTDRLPEAQFDLSGVQLSNNQVLVANETDSELPIFSITQRPPAFTVTVPYSPGVTQASSNGTASPAPPMYVLLDSNLNNNKRCRKIKRAYENVTNQFFNSGPRKNRNVPCPTCNGTGELENFKSPVGIQEGEEWEEKLYYGGLLDKLFKQAIGATARSTTPNYIKKGIEEYTLSKIAEIEGPVTSAMVTTFVNTLEHRYHYKRDSIEKHIWRVVDGGVYKGGLWYDPSLDILSRMTVGTDGLNFSRLERYRLMYKLQWGKAAPERKRDE